MRIIKITREEFETEDGSVFPIIPPLTEDMTVEEFQRHYDYASEVVRGSTTAGGNNPDTSGLGSNRKN